MARVCLFLSLYGGDATLAVKDISAWRGNQDKPIQEFAFEEFTTADASKLNELLADEEHSDVRSIHLTSAKSSV